MEMMFVSFIFVADCSRGLTRAPRLTAGAAKVRDFLTPASAKMNKKLRSPSAFGIVLKRILIAQNRVANLKSGNVESKSLVVP